MHVAIFEGVGCPEMSSPFCVALRPLMELARFDWMNELERRERAEGEGDGFLGCMKGRNGSSMVSWMDIGW